jgi:hypothetical protein
VKSLHAGRIRHSALKAACRSALLRALWCVSWFTLCVYLELVVGIPRSSCQVGRLWVTVYQGLIVQPMFHKPIVAQARLVLDAPRSGIGSPLGFGGSDRSAMTMAPISVLAHLHFECIKPAHVRRRTLAPCCRAVFQQYANSLDPAPETKSRRASICASHASAGRC